MNIEAALDLLKYNDTVFASLGNDIKLNVYNHIKEQLPLIKTVNDDNWITIAIFDIGWNTPYIARFGNDYSMLEKLEDGNTTAIHYDEAGLFLSGEYDSICNDILNILSKLYNITI